MTLSFTKRTAAGVFVASGVLFGYLAGPAAADEEVGEITAGTLEVGSLDPFDLGDSDLCPASTIDVTFSNIDEVNDTADTEVTGISAVSVFQNPGNSNWYRVELALEPFFAPYLGSISGSSASQDIALTATIRDLGSTEPTECPGPTAGSFACTATAFDASAVGPINLTGSWAPSTSPQPPGTAVLGGSGDISAPTGSCPDSLIRSQINSQTVTVTGLTVAFP